MLDTDNVKLLENNLPFWEQLNNTQRDMIISNARVVNYKKNENLHCGDSECMGLLYVKEGELRTFMISDEGREITLFRLEKNEFCILSASCILSAITFDVSIDANSDCQVIQLGSHILSLLSKENVYVELFTYKLAAERFSDVMWAMQQILFTSFDKRLAAFLLDEALKEHSDEIHMTHEQMAKYLSSAREVVSRMLKYFSKEGYVVLLRGGVRIADKKGLQKLIS